jgi:hypothetical protein
MSTQYRILFEVKVLHEYYLTDPDNTSVFQEATQTGRLAWLDRRYKSDQPVISDDLAFGLSSPMKILFKNQGLLLVPGVSGFQVAIRTNAVTLPDGTIGYVPAIPLDGDLNLLIMLQQTGTEFSRITNGRMRRTVDSLYYFTNADVGGARTPPVLSRPISNQVAGYGYEQGELSAVPSTTPPEVELCYYTISTPPGSSQPVTTQQFEVIPGNGFVNENDRMIVGRSLVYRFDPSDKVTDAQFTLLDQAGNTIRTIARTGTTVLETVPLNFDDSNNSSPLITLPGAAATDPILYTLQVSGTDSYTKTLSLIFYDIPADLLAAWGILQIQMVVDNPTMSLLDANGRLNLPVLPPPDASNSPYPVFEIRCKSRYTFWRYSSDDATKILDSPTGAIADFLEGTTGILTTKLPVPGTYLPFFFSTNPAATPPAFTYLPNPPPDTIVQPDGPQVFSNILVPESGIFPMGPAPP